MKLRTFRVVADITVAETTTEAMLKRIGGEFAGGMKSAVERSYLRDHPHGLAVEVNYHGVKLLGERTVPDPPPGASPPS